MVGPRPRFGLMPLPASVRLAALVLLPVLAAGPSWAVTFTVNSTSDADDPDLIADGTCDSDPGAPVVCTLREAIREANATGVLDTIRFIIPPGGVQTIAPTSTFLSISQPVIIDGTTQTGYAGTPLIELNGASAGAVHGLTLSGAASSNSTIKGLVINGFNGVGCYGIRVLAGSINNLILGNYLGTDPTGTLARPNRTGMILQTSGNRVGGVLAGEPNLISGNTEDGIQISTDSGDTNRVEGNYIGVNALGTAARANGGQGVAILNSADNNTIGGLAAGQGNLISGNGNDGVLIAQANTTGNFVQGNRIGTNAAGTAAIPNLKGVEISNSASLNTVGGALGSQNVISGNISHGVLIAAASNNTVSRALIGTDAAGTARVANQQHGVELVNGATGNTIGGNSGEGNVISGNTWHGVDVSGAATSGNIIRGNLIGLAFGGDLILGNNQFGVAIAQGANGNTVGDPTGGNIISGNGLGGVRIVDAATNNNVVQSNFIGLDVTGTQARPNLAEGVILDAPAAATGNRIGGVGFANVISGNGTVGVRILNSMTGTLVVANVIGRDLNNSFTIGNGSGGVRIQDSSGNRVGGSGANEGNVIAGNSGSDGVAVVGATASGNAILGNSIYANAGLGIDLGDDGVTANDDGDGDAGPNGLQNTAVLSAVVTNGARVHVAGSFSGPVAGVYRVEFFRHAVAAADPTGFGEGRYYLGFQSVTTDASGYGLIATTLTAAVPASVDYVTATVTDPSSNTSEFSRNYGASGELIVTTTASAADALDLSSISALVNDNGADNRISLREAITATNNTGGADTIRFGIPLTDGGHVYYQNDGLPGLPAATTVTPRADADIANFDLDYPVGFTRSWYRISPSPALPSVTGPVVIDGETQPGFFAGAPVVELDGGAAGIVTGGLVLTAGSSTVRGLVVNGFVGTNQLTGNALALSGPGGYTVTGNYLGTDVSGTRARANTSSGVFFEQLSGAASRVGGNTAALRNLISGNTRQGVFLYGFSGTHITSQVLIQGNYIGTDMTGGVGLNAQGRGVYAEFTGGHVIGGAGFGEGNLVSGNAGAGIELNGNNSGGCCAPASNNVVEGNRIGTNAAGTALIGNAERGVLLYGFSNAASAAHNNVIRGNVIGGSGGGLEGIWIEGNADDNLIEGNFIGTDTTGTLDFGNTGDGIGVRSQPGYAPTGNTIRSNVIRFNDRDGVRVVGDSTVLTLTQNQISDNDALGIDLGGDGVTANDSGDGDTGPNDLLNFPSFPPPVESVAGTLSVTYGFDLPAGWYRVEFFKNASGADLSGFGEGQTFASSVVVEHLGGGPAAYSHSFGGTTGEVISATTTACLDLTVDCTNPGSTSEFSRAWAAVPTAVRLLSFTATGGDESVLLEWQTGSELDNLGFHLHRGSSETGPWTRITPSLIPGLGASPLGASYSWQDGGLVNGTRYYYRLEDVDTRSVSTFHGPVSAVPSSPGEDGEGEGGEDGTERGASCPSWVLAGAPDVLSPVCTRYGDPDSTSLQILARDSSSATIELQTGGFWVLHGVAGEVLVFVPGLEFPSDPQAPALPLRRALVEAVVGKQVELVSAEAFDLRAFGGLRPSAVGIAEMAVGADGTVRPARRGVGAGVPSRGYVPREVARLAGTVFQGERKSAVVEITPVRFSGLAQELVLAGRVRVMLAFTGVAEGEGETGSRGWAAPRRKTRRRDIVAQLHTAQRGLHAVSFERLFPQRGRGFSTAFLRLQRQGEAVAFHVEPSGPVFGPGSVLYFFADRTALSTDYSSEVAYELVRTAGVQMGVAPSPPAGAPAVLASTGFASFETNRIYQPGLLEAPDVWLWEAMGSGVTRTNPFTLSGVDGSSGEMARLVVHLQGGSASGRTSDHHVRVSLNGVEVREATFAGKQAQRVEVSVAASALREGVNELGVTNAGDTGVSSLVFLDRFEVSYPQASTVRDGVFEGVWGEGGTVEVGGLTGVPVILGDSPLPGSEPSTVRWVTGFQATPGSVRFQAEAGERYVVVTPEGLLSPRIGRMPLSTLRDRTNQADYLVIAPREFLGAAQALVERRRGQGLSSRAVSFEEISSEFGHAQPSAEAIRAFLEYAWHSWQPPSPRYVLLLGDSTVDPRKFVATSGPSPLPALWTRTSYLWTVSDPALGAVNGEDLVPDLAIGRLPATTVEQAESLVAKLLAWEETGQDLGEEAVLVADNPDMAGDFEADVEDIRASFLSGRETTVLRLSELGAATRATILGAFDNGASLMSYVGHGGTAVWASENVLNTWDVPALQAQSRQPLLLTLNCLNGYFVTPNLDSLPEALLKAEGRGVVGAFSPSGLSLDGPAHQYHRAVMAELVSGEHARLGDAILAAQRTYAESGIMPELLNVYHLLGDPAMSLPQH